MRALLQFEVTKIDGGFDPAISMSPGEATLKSNVEIAGAKLDVCACCDASDAFCTRFKRE